MAVTVAKEADLLPNDIKKIRIPIIHFLPSRVENMCITLVHTIGKL